MERIELPAGATFMAHLEYLEESAEYRKVFLLGLEKVDHGGFVTPNSNHR